MNSLLFFFGQSCDSPRLISEVCFSISAVAIFMLLCRIYYNKQNKVRFWIIVAFILLFLNSLLQTFITSQVIGDFSIMDRGYTDHLTIVFLSILNAASNFIGATRIFDNGIQNFLFDNQEYMFFTFVAYIFCFGWSILIVSDFIISNWFANSWLKANAPKGKNDVRYIFWGKNIHSIQVAKSLKGKVSPDKIVLIDYPCEEDEFDESIISKLYYFLKRDNENNNIWTVVKAKVNLKDVNFDSSEGELKGFLKTLGLKGLESWMAHPQTECFILDEDKNEDYNIACLNNMLLVKGINCKIYVHARHDGIIAKYQADGVLHSNVEFIDSSKLAVRNLIKGNNISEEQDPYALAEKRFLDDNGKKLKELHNYGLSVFENIRNETDRKESATASRQTVEGNLYLHPVRVMDIDREKGFARGGFNSMILGFGETGREALAFLYEYSAIPLENFDRAPFVCRIYDDQMEKAHGIFKSEAPSFSEKEVYFNNTKVGSTDFWNDVEKNADQLQYVVVCLGDDHLNLEIGTKLLECIYKKRENIDNLVIAINLGTYTPLFESCIQSYNAAYGPHIYRFGSNDTIWDYNFITNKDMEEDAEMFFNTYYEALIPTPVSPDGSKGEKKYDDWKTRNEKIRSIHHLYSRRDLIRMRNQDYSNCYHKFTKKQLCNTEDSDLMWLSQQICSELKVWEPYGSRPVSVHIDNWENISIDKKEEKLKVLEYLAACEHLRWVASHIVNGYSLGSCKDMLKKQHSDITGYTNLSIGTQHYDWVVVKTTLMDDKL